MRTKLCNWDKGRVLGHLGSEPTLHCCLIFLDWKLLSSLKVRESEYYF